MELCFLDRQTDLIWEVWPLLFRNLGLGEQILLYMYVLRDFSVWIVFSRPLNSLGNSDPPSLSFSLCPLFLPPLQTERSEACSHFGCEAKTTEQKNMFRGEEPATRGATVQTRRGFRSTKLGVLATLCSVMRIPGPPCWRRGLIQPRSQCQ